VKIALVFPKVGGPISDGSLTSIEKSNWLASQLNKHFFGFGKTNFIPPMALTWILQHRFYQKKP
jgi:hypothetical protein